jgi:hypothetical protein
MKQKIIFITALFFMTRLSTIAQNSNIVDTSKYKSVNNLVPRLGIGISRHFIGEFGIAYVRSRFNNHKDFGLNTSISSFYFSFEIMTASTKPLIYGYKIGVEIVTIGHVTGAGGIEIAYYEKDTNSSFAIIPKIGIPLLNGSLSYGLGIYFNSSMRKEIGTHILN